MLDSTSPIFFRIKGERFIQVHLDDGSKTQKTAIIQDHEHKLELHGSFADAIFAVVQQKYHPVLKHIEKTNHWLTGLSTANIIKGDNQKLLLGAGLGMLFIELTSRCNERCIHCYANSSPDRNEFLPFQQIQLLLDQASQLGKPFIQFTGGDPLIHPQLVEAVAYAHQLGLERIEIYTNGLLLHPDLLAKLTPFSPRFCFSLYSHEPSIHDNITRVSGSLNKTLTAIQHVQQQGLEVRIGIALMQQNADSLVGTLNFLHNELSIPAHCIRIDPINRMGRGANTTAADNIHIQHTTAPHTPEDINQHKKRLGKLCITASGDVHPCIFSRDIVLGNIQQSSLKNIIDNLNETPRLPSSTKRWQACKERLSCYDCRIIAYHLSANSKEPAA